MSASERAAELRALADQHESLGQLEADLDAAVGAYRADPTEETKAAYRAASEVLASARQEIRSSSVMVAASEPGSVTVGASTVRKVN